MSRCSASSGTAVISKLPWPPGTEADDEHGDQRGEGHLDSARHADACEDQRDDKYDDR